jgi:hypothetical protein
MLKIKAYTAYYLLKYIYGYDVSIGCTVSNGDFVSFTINNDYNKVSGFKKNYPHASLSIKNDHEGFVLTTYHNGKNENYSGKMSDMIKIWNQKHFKHIN